MTAADTVGTVIGLAVLVLLVLVAPVYGGLHRHESRPREDE